MRITNKADYAVRTILCLAKNKNKMKRASEISEKMKIPINFVAKILQMLRKHKLVQSVRGINGGFKLSRRPEKITLLEVIEIIDGPFAINQCVVDRRVCSLINSCPVHPVWVKLKNDMRKKLKMVNFRNLAKI